MRICERKYGIDRSMILTATAVRRLELDVLLSLFSGAGGLDAGFEDAGYTVGLAYDKRPEAIASYNLNRPRAAVGKVVDVTTLGLVQLDRDFGETFRPTGIIGGPPCQSFSKANSGRSLDDPRAKLVEVFVSLALQLHDRSSLDFVVMENVPELIEADDERLLQQQNERLAAVGFHIATEVLNAADFGVPQNRRRMFMVALNKERHGSPWAKPNATVSEAATVFDAISKLPPPVYFERPIRVSGYHPNHWCMKPKSPRFFNGTLVQGYSAGRSFKTLSWQKPSLAVSYGNREVHIHPSGTRRLSVHEAMLLQGFPKSYVLHGSLSSQITQVSEAVPPPLARVVAQSIGA